MLPSFDIAGFSANSMLHLSGVDLVECSSLHKYNHSSSSSATECVD